MTFTEIVSDVTSRLNLTSAGSTTRVGETTNRVYKKITTSIGLNVSRHYEATATASIGTQFVTFSGVEKINSVYDQSSGQNHALAEVSITELDRMAVADSDTPTHYAVYRVNAGTVQIKTNVNAQTAYELLGAGFERASTLSGSQEPAFPESFHDIVVEGVLYEEYLKLEKAGLAAMSKANYEDRMGDLRIFIAKSPQQDIYVGKMATGGIPTGGVGGSSGGSGSANGTLSYTQTGVIAFDRTSMAAGLRYPFTVAVGSEKVANLDADYLDGESGSAYHSATNLSAGTVPDARFPATLPAVSGANLTNLDATDLTGTIADARHSSNVPLKDGTNVFTGACSFANIALSLPVGQISFPATQNPSSDANTLDDYEEGSWAPEVGGTGGKSGQAYATQIGRYIKIGQQVTCWGRFTLSALGTLTTQVQLEGLPFTCHATARGSVMITYFNAMTASCIILSGQVSVNSLVAPMFVIKAAATGMSNLVQGDLSNTTEWGILVSYRSAA